MTETATVIVRASLRARLYRDIEVLRSSTLAALAETIVAAFGFDMDHAYGFYSKLTGNLFGSPVRFELFADIEGGGSRSVKRTRVFTAFPTIGSAMTFLYDYGDEWRFRVEVVEIRQTQAGTKYPRIVKMVGKAPPQYPNIEEE
jgi:hypothetical protein